MISSSVNSDGVAEVVMDNPPVNALPAAGWFAQNRPFPSVPSVAIGTPCSP